MNFPLKINYKWIIIMACLVILGCYSKKNKTEERVKQRVTEFIMLMVKDRVEAAEELLSHGMTYGGNKELFLSSFDNWQLKDTSDVTIEFYQIYIPEDDPQDRAMVNMVVKGHTHNFTKLVNMSLIYEKGDWYIGAP
jgi:hypothetical protein